VDALPERQVLEAASGPGFGFLVEEGFSHCKPINPGVMVARSSVNSRHPTLTGEERASNPGEVGSSSRTTVRRRTQGGVMHMRRTRARILAAAAIFALVVGGAAYAGTALKAAKVKVVAIATPAQTNDYGWNSQGVSNAKAAAAAFGAKVTSVTNIGYDKTDVVLRQLAKSGANFIIAHASGYDTVAGRIAQQYKSPIMTYDIPTMLVKNYVSNITTQSQEGSYLAGILAARTTKTHKVGIVISASDPNWYKMSGGFAAGVRSIDKSAKIIFATIGPASYDDAAGGKR